MRLTVNMCTFSLTYRDNKLGLDSPGQELNDTIYTFTEMHHPLLCQNEIVQFSLGTLHSAVLTGMCHTVQYFKNILYHLLA